MTDQWKVADGLYVRCLRVCQAQATYVHCWASFPQRWRLIVFDKQFCCIHISRLLRCSEQMIRGFQQRRRSSDVIRTSRYPIYNGEPDPHSANRFVLRAASSTWSFSDDLCQFCISNLSIVHNITQLALTGRAQHRITVVEYDSRNNCLHMMSDRYIIHVYAVLLRQAMKPSVLTDIPFKSHSRSSAMSYFVRQPGLSIRDQKSKPHLLSGKSS